MHQSDIFIVDMEISKLVQEFLIVGVDLFVLEL